MSSSTAQASYLSGLSLVFDGERERVSNSGFRLEATSGISPVSVTISHV